MLTAAVRQELPGEPTDDIGAEPTARKAPPSAPVLGHLVVILKPRVMAALCAVDRLNAGHAHIWPGLAGWAGPSLRAGRPGLWWPPGRRGR
jgi:hypothetical protein